MGDVVVGIHQPNFFPWFGFFLKIARSDKFVFLDDAQTPKKGGSYLNRTKININGESKWITAPIKRTYGLQLINKTYYSATTPWRNNMLKTLQMNYGNAPYYKKNNLLIFALLNYKSNSVSEFNIFFITEICKALNISTSLYSSSSFSINKVSTERLISIVKAINGNVYLSGLGGDKYQDINLFNEDGIKLRYNEFEHPEYRQFKSNTFIFGLSILDIIFHRGLDETKLIIYNHRL